VLPKPVTEALIRARYSGPVLPSGKVYETYTSGTDGIEIGGPSLLFKTTLPLYRTIRSLDGVNFSSNTIWEGSLDDGDNFRYYGYKRGRQIISEASELAKIKPESYDFVLSSNCLEHVANPLKALIEWKRVIRRLGALILVLPNKESNFDHGRPVTEFSHLLEDMNLQKTEHDLTHLDEILALHDLSMDPAAGTLDDFKQRSLRNFENRTLHHHIFDIALMRKMLDHVGLDVIDTQQTSKDFFALAIKR
jgi:SAM-dependent methyltransferase